MLELVAEGKHAYLDWMSNLEVIGSQSFTDTRFRQSHVMKLDSKKYIILQAVSLRILHRGNFSCAFGTGNAQRFSLEI